MPWNPSPQVAAARDIAGKFGKDRVILLMLNDAERTIEYASYGWTAALCKDTRRLADAAMAAVQQAY